MAPWRIRIRHSDWSGHGSRMPSVRVGTTRDGKYASTVRCPTLMSAVTGMPGVIRKPNRQVVQLQLIQRQVATKERRTTIRLCLRHVGPARPAPALLRIREAGGADGMQGAGDGAVGRIWECVELDHRLIARLGEAGIPCRNAGLDLQWRVGGPCSRG
jgi:hypothetical protein